MATSSPPLYAVTGPAREAQAWPSLRRALPCRGAHWEGGLSSIRLQLPARARIHDVFHVGLLKPFRGEPPAAPPALPPIANGRILPEPAKVLQAQLRRGIWLILVQWAGLPEEEATWEQREEFRQHYPDFQLEDGLFAQAGRDVMTGLVYTRKRPTGH